MRSQKPVYFVICTLALCMLLCPVPAGADIIDDINGIITSARNRATEARDRAGEARANAQAVRDDLQNRLNLLTSEMRSFALEATDDIQMQIDQRIEGRAAFVADGGCSQAICQPFRQSLVTFFVDLEATINATYAVAGMPETQVDFQRFIDVIQAAPGRALFLTYRALGGADNVLSGGLLDRLAEARVHLESIREAIEQDRVITTNLGASGASLLDSELVMCEYWVQQGIGNWDFLSTAIGAIGVAQKGMGALIQGIMMLDGGEAVSAGLPVVNVKIESDPTDLATLFFETLGETFFWAGNYIRAKAYYCSLVAARGNIRDLITDPNCEDGDPLTPCDFDIPGDPNRPLVTTLRDDTQSGLTHLLAQQQQIQQNQTVILQKVQMLKAGDMNLDGITDGLDIQVFVDRLLSPGG